MSESSTLRAAFGKLLEGLTVDALIFTTFTFDPEFFESNVLPIVTGVEHISTIGELQYASEEADKLGVAVFHDGRVRGKRMKRATYPTVPVFLEGGVFHPKVVVASGSTARGEQTRLLVSSANLTFAGWGHQRECVVRCEVQSSQTAQPLLRLLRWLAQQDASRADSAARERLDLVIGRLAQIRGEDDGVQLHVSLPGEHPSFSRIFKHSSGPMTISAPYFSPGFSSWVKRVAPGRELRLIPALVDGQADLITTDLEALASQSEVSFSRFADGDTTRFDHLKLTHVDGRLFIGSHNATMAALGASADDAPQNVEASVSVPSPRFPYSTESMDPPPGKSLEQKAEERELLLSPLPTWISVVLHWAASVYRVEVGGPLEGYEVRLPGLDAPVAFHSGEFAISGRVEEVAQALQSRRVFNVVNADGELVHEGFINETGWTNARPVGRYGTLHDCFDAWRARTPSRGAAETSRLHLLGGEGDGYIDDMEQGNLTRVVSSDLLETYFSFYRAVRGLRESMDVAAQSTASHADALMMRYIDRAPGSLREAYRHIVEQTAEPRDEDLVFWFVVAHELKKLAVDAVEWSSRWPAVCDAAGSLCADFVALCKQSQEAGWVRKTAVSDGPRLRFILSALGYEDVAV